MFHAIEKGTGKLGAHFATSLSPSLEHLNSYFSYLHGVLMPQDAGTPWKQNGQLFAILSTFFMLFSYLFYCFKFFAVYFC